MTGRRQKKRHRRRLTGILVLFCVLSVVVSPGGPAGIAADSPVERILPREPEVPVTVEAEVELLPEEEPVVEEVIEEPWAPVAETMAVEDSYFADAAFLGDSRTEGFYLYSGLKEGAYFYAVGSTVESVFSKKVWGPEESKIPLLDAMAKGGPYGKIYVMLGVNELGWSKAEVFRDQYVKVIQRLQEDHPGAEIIIQPVFPVSSKQETKKTYVNNARIQTYNEIIMTIAEEMGCFYVNMTEAVVGEDGCLRPELTSDGVHLNIKGCKLWLEYLKTHSVSTSEASCFGCFFRVQMPQESDSGV